MQALIISILDRLPWGILGPLAFLLICCILVFACPEDDKGKLIFLIVGAALTRVKFSPPPDPIEPPKDPINPAI